MINIKYNKDIDKLKGMGIILTVIGHSGGWLSPVIYLFHMPLFYFLSGYIFKESHTENIPLFLKKKIKGLYIPFIKFGVIFVILHNIFVKIGIYPENMIYDKETFVDNLFKNLVFINTEQLTGAFWFITSIFITNIMFVFILKKLKKSKKKNLYIILLTIVLFLFNISVLSKIKFQNTVLNYYFIMFRISLSGLIFFGLGNILGEKDIISKLKKNIAFVLLGCMYLFINTNYGAISMGSNQYGSSPTFFIFNALIGILVCSNVVKYIKNAKIESFFIICGKNTLEILALHMLSFKIVNLMQIKFYKYPISYLSSFPYISGEKGWWIEYSIVGIFVPIILLLIIDISKKCFIKKQK